MRPVLHRRRSWRHSQKLGMAPGARAYGGPAFRSFPRSFAPRRDAAEWARRLEDEMARGTFLHRGEAERLTVVAALERYLREISPSKKPTLNLHWNFFGAGENFWFWNEAITMYAFYLVGVLVNRREVLALSAPRAALLIAAIAASAIVYFTYDLNDGPFRMKISAVVILAAAHGQIIWFVLTAFAGTVAILLLAAATPAWGWLRYMGQNALIFFCLNGVVYHHVNPRLAHWFIASLPQDGWSLGLYATALSVLSLAAGVPVAILLNRYVPQLVGRPSVSGPWLPALVQTNAASREAGPMVVIQKT